MSPTNKSPPTTTQPFTLVPMNLSNPSEINELISQRKICGWNHSMSNVTAWHDSTAKGLRWMWWIEIPSPPSSPTPTRAGHIHLAADTSPSDLDLARPDRSILTVNTFFILPEYRGTGLGRAVWMEVEERARRVPECRRIAIDTWDRRYMTDDGPEWGGFLESLGIPMRKEGVINEDWYARLGYVKFREEGRYPLPGTDQLMKAVLMRKEIK